MVGIKHGNSWRLFVTQKAPDVSVVMPVHNGVPFLSDSISSILNQTYQDFEFIIIDDGSTDQTQQVLSRFKKLSSSISVVTNQSNLGIAYSLNKGLAQARGRYIARMDSDDIAIRNRLQKQVQECCGGYRSSASKHS